MRVIFEQLPHHLWAHWFTIIAFTFSFSVFLGCLWYAWKLPKENGDYMAHLPLDDSNNSTSETPSTTGDNSHATK